MDSRLLRLRDGLLAGALLCFAPLGVVAADLAEPMGTWRFADGSCVTGGRFDESGSRLLLYTDTVANRRGGLFAPDGGGFLSVIDGRTRIRFEGGGQALHWSAADATLAGRRIHAPRRVDAGFRGDAGAIAGTLYLPADVSGAPFPGMVLAHGSGAQNRHAGPWTTFFVDLGFAVLAYDKRGVGGSEGDLAAADYGDLQQDLATAVHWLAARPEVDARRVGIHASSESGWYAPDLAARDEAVAFLIQRAGPPLPTGSTTGHERTEEWRADGLAAGHVAAAADFWRRLMAAADRGEPVAVAQGLLDHARARPWFANAFGDWHAIRPQWWGKEQRNARFRPATDGVRRPVPTLWFLAERDQNVPYAASLRALQATQAAHGALRIVTVADADHGFLVRGVDGSIRYTDDYWPVMAAWLREHALSGPATPAAACDGR